MIRNYLRCSNNSVHRIAWSPDHPDVVWMLKDRTESDHDGEKRFCYLVAFRLQEESQNAVQVSELELGHYRITDQLPPSGHSLTFYKDILHAHVYGNYLQINTADPAHPEIMQQTEYRGGVREKAVGRKVCLTVPMIPANHLSPQERLTLTIRLVYHPVIAYENNLLVETYRDYLGVHKLTALNEHQAEFESIGSRRRTPLEKIIKTWPKTILIKNDFAYVIYEPGLNSGLQVFDISQPGAIPKVGHFARPEEQFLNLSSIGDGRILLLGNDLHILESPRANH